MRIFTWMTGLAIVTAAPHPLAAQEMPLDGLRPGQTVRVTTTDGARVIARIGRDPADALPLRPGNIDSVWIRGNRVLRGALLGGAAGGLLTYVAMYTLCTGSNDGTCNGKDQVAGIALVGGALGAAVGAGIGAMLPTWRLHYARNRSAVIRPALTTRGVGVTVRF